LGYTLDQLLETTGVDGLAGRGLKKVAAKKDTNDLLKLAERCRRAADVVEEVVPQIDEHALVEKTAAVQIIRRTLSEIRQIDGGPGVEKTAAVAADPRQAVFIKAALEAGHDPKSIATFLEQPQPPRRNLPEVKRKKSATSMIG